MCVIVGVAHTKLSWAGCSCSLYRQACAPQRRGIGFLPSGGFQPARSSEESFLSPAVHALQRIFYQQKKLFYNQLDVHPQSWGMKGVLKDQGNRAWKSCKPGDSSRWHGPARMGQMIFGVTSESAKVLDAAPGVGVIRQNARKGMVPRKEGLGGPWCVLWWAEKTVNSCSCCGWTLMSLLGAPSHEDP